MSQSLSNNYAQDATLQRIENYSRASLQSSAHSITSLNSIRNELSRLEARISGSSVGEKTSPGRVEQDLLMTPPSEGSTQAYFERKGTIQSNEPCHRTAPGITSSTDTLARPSTPKAVPPASQLPEQSSDGSIAPSVPPYGSRHHSSYVYASFSAIASDSVHYHPTKPHKKPFNPGSIHDILQKSLLECYPPCVENYISVHNLLTLCYNHVELLNHSTTVRPHIERYEKTARKETSYSSQLKGQIESLKKALQLLRQQCIQAGYSLAKIDSVLLRAGVSHIPKRTVSPEQFNSSEDEDWKDVSERLPNE